MSGNSRSGGAPAGGVPSSQNDGTNEHPSRLLISSSRKPVSYVHLAKRCLQEHGEVQLSALGVAISSMVTLAEILKNKQLAVETRVVTSLEEIHSESRTRHKPKMSVTLVKSPQFDDIVAAEGARNFAQEFTGEHAGQGAADNSSGGDVHHLRGGGGGSSGGPTASRQPSRSSSRSNRQPAQAGLAGGGRHYVDPQHYGDSFANSGGYQPYADQPSMGVYGSAQLGVGLPPYAPSSMLPAGPVLQQPGISLQQPPFFTQEVAGMPPHLPQDFQHSGWPSELQLAARNMQQGPYQPGQAPAITPELAQQQLHAQMQLSQQQQQPQQQMPAQMQPSQQQQQPQEQMPAQMQPSQQQQQPQQLAQQMAALGLGQHPYVPGPPP